jgi:predicted nucleic acid-binding Zn ribbon protein
MPTFTLTCTDEDSTVTTKEFKSAYLQEVVEKTGDFLRGVGYYFDDLTIVKVEETEETIEDDSYEEYDPITGTNSIIDPSYLNKN